MNLGDRRRGQNSERFSVFKVWTKRVADLESNIYLFNSTKLGHHWICNNSNGLKNRVERNY